MKARIFLLFAIPVVMLLAGCQTDKKTKESPEPEKTVKKTPPAAPKAEPAKQGTALDALLGGGKRPSLLDTDNFTEAEREIIRAQERERARPPQKRGPGIYDKESKARKDWVF